MTNDDFTLGMGFVPPMAVTLANLVSNVAASALPAWAAPTSYAEGAQVVDAGIEYQSLAAANVGNLPATSPTKWKRINVDPRLRMFDKSLGTHTERDDLIEVTLTPNQVVTDVLLVGVQAHQVQVLMNDPVSGLVFDSEDVLMLKPSGNSHWGYFLNPIERETKLHIGGMPAYTRASLTIRIKNPGAKARCVEAIVGRAVWLGNTRWRPTIGFDDWSLKKRDDWGGWTAEQGAFSDRLELQVLVRGTNYEWVRNQLLPWRAKPVGWIGSRGINALTSIGYITAFKQVLMAHGQSDCQMVIEGLEDTTP